MVQASRQLVETIEESADPFDAILLSGRITKSAINRIPVSELRQKCQELGLSAEGLKSSVVDRLLEWAKGNSDHADRKALANGMNYVATSQPLRDGESSSSSTEVVEKFMNGTGNDEGHQVELGSRTTMAIPSEASDSVGIDDEAKGVHQLVSVAASAAPEEALVSISKEMPSTSSQSSALRGMETRDIRITWLGTSSGAPTNRRNVSCIAVRYGQDRVFLVDSGEGTRNQMRNAGIDPALITDIFITHLHGDHCFGIAGTLLTIANARAGTPKESEPVRIYGPQDLQRLLIASIRAAGLALKMPIVLVGWVFDPKRAIQPPAPVNASGKLFIGFQAPDQSRSQHLSRLQTVQNAYDSGSDNIVRQGLTWTVTLPDGLQITAAQLQHRMPCWGYVFQEPDEHVGDSDVIMGHSGLANGIDSSGSDDESGKSCVDGGSYGLNRGSDVKIRPGRKLVLLGDTCDSWAIAEKAAGCDVISHEATFNRGMEDKARVATHSTAEQAGAFARAIGARALVLTHFSARYEQLDKYSKMIRVAKAQDMTVGKMQSNSVASTLREEAAAAAGGMTRVYLANDFYTFHVPARPLILEKELQEEKRKTVQAVRAGMKSIPRNQRPSKPSSAMDGERGGYENRRHNYKRSGNRKHGNRKRDRPSYGREAVALEKTSEQSSP